MIDKKKIFLALSAAFVGFMIYAGIDMMTNTTPPWQKKKTEPQLIELEEDSTSQIFADTTIYLYRVRKKDALSTIAGKFNCRTNFIRELNQLPSDKISENQIVKVRVRAIHRVQKNEFIEKIARKYEVDSREIMQANHLSRPEQLRADQDIVIPVPGKNN